MVSVIFAEFFRTGPGMTSPSYKKIEFYENIVTDNVFYCYLIDVIRDQVLSCLHI